MKKRILITGGTGFAGSHLTELLLALGEQEITVTSHSGKNDFTASILPENSVRKLDLRDLAATISMLEEVKPTQIYHLSSIAAVGKSFEIAQTILTDNLLMQHSILEAMRVASPEARLLSVGSAEEYGLNPSDKIDEAYDENHPFLPINPYAVSKISQEMLAHAYRASFGMDILRVRPFNHIGERQSTEFAVSAFTARILAAQKAGQTKISVGNLTGIRDFTDVKDMVAAYVLVMNTGISGEVYNIGTGVGTSMQTILDMLLSLTRANVVVEPDQALFRPLDIPKMVAQSDRIKALGWQPTHALEETLSRIIAWHREQP